MAIVPELVISHEFQESTCTYTERDAVIYALGVGACSRDAVDEKELKYVYHKDGQSSIQVLPTFPATFSLLAVGALEKMPGLKFDFSHMLHGQQYMEIYKPFPSHGFIKNKAVIAGLHDKGKATVLEIETTSYSESGEALCMNRNTLYLRGAGGFSKSSSLYSYSKYPTKQISPVRIPKYKPFVVYEDITHQSQALLYRLSGDYNPLHSDPTIARVAGFSHPILHGLCTLGFAVRAIIKCVCNGDPSIVKNILGRFLLHVYPGETLITEMWVEGLRVLFQTRVKERDRAVLSGYVVLSHIPSSL